MNVKGTWASDLISIQFNFTVNYIHDVFSLRIHHRHSMCQNDREFRSLSVKFRILFLFFWRHRCRSMETETTSIIYKCKCTGNRTALMCRWNLHVDRLMRKICRKFSKIKMSFSIKMILIISITVMLTLIKSQNSTENEISSSSAI